jgi:hypothetical protein
MKGMFSGKLNFVVYDSIFNIHPSTNNDDDAASAAVSQKAEFFKQVFTVWKAGGAALIGQTLPSGLQEFPFAVQLSAESATQVLLEEYEVGRDSTVHAITETHSYY